MYSNRTAIEKERDFALISALYIMGKPWTDILENLKGFYPDVTLDDLGNDINEIRERWVSAYDVSATKQRAKELAHLDELERQAYLGWTSSIQAHTADEVETLEDNIVVSSGNVVPRKTSKTKHKETLRDGSYPFLQLVMNCIITRSKLLGLFAAEKTISMDYREAAKAAGIDEKALEDEKERLTKQFMEMAMAAKNGSN